MLISQVGFQEAHVAAWCRTWERAQLQKEGTNNFFFK
jgi:hypothetical protein